MRVIVLASQKGGSGKTTLSGHLAVQADLSGAGPVALIDTDPQGSLAKWWNARAAETPAFVSARFDNLHTDLESLRAQGFKLVFIDTPPAVTQAISNVVRHADLVVLPTRPSPHDLRAVGATVEIVESHAKPMIFVLNAATARAKITAEAAVALSQHGTVAPITLHHRVDFAASMTDGRTVMEYNTNCASAKEVRELWEYMRDRLARLDHAPREFQDPFAGLETFGATDKPEYFPAGVAAVTQDILDINNAPVAFQNDAVMPELPAPAQLAEQNPQHLLMEAVRRLRGDPDNSDDDAILEPITLEAALEGTLKALESQASASESSPGQEESHPAPSRALWQNVLAAMSDAEERGFASNRGDKNSDPSKPPSKPASRFAPTLRAVSSFGRRWQ